MKCSVAMATYNGEKYIVEQLDSLKDQELQPDEVIICDDGSKDNTVSIISEYIRQYHLEDRWQLIVNDTNLGFANNFHNAILKCSGDLIFPCDQDDIWKPEKIRVMKEVMEHHPRVSLLCSDFEPLRSSPDAHELRSWDKRDMNDSGSLVKVPLDSHYIYLRRLGCVMALRRDYLQRAEKYWYSGWAHDEYLWRTALCEDGLYVLHMALIQRRLHSDNVSLKPLHTVDVRVKYLRDLEKSYEAMQRCAEDNCVGRRGVRLIRRSIRASRLRADMVEKRKIINIVPLLLYLDCYYVKRAYLTEPLIALRQ